MEASMATRPAPVLRRDTSHRVLAGVCAGVARHMGVDPLIVRVLFLAAAMAGGVGIAVYLLAWVFVPAGDAPAQPVRLRTSRGMIEITVGVAFLALSVLLTFRALGLLFSDAIVWPLALVAAGGALLWRQSMGRGPVVVDRTAAEGEPSWYAAELDRARALREAARPASATSCSRSSSSPSCSR
jgi:phage shock protein PspC (stress-responsive transcriptional regulator)